MKIRITSKHGKLVLRVKRERMSRILDGAASDILRYLPGLFGFLQGFHDGVKPEPPQHPPYTLWPCPACGGMLTHEVDCPKHSDLGVA